MMNSKYVFSVFDPEYLVELLRAGGRFPVWQTFDLPLPDDDENKIRDIIDKKFPALSEDRHEIWLKFRLSEHTPVNSFSLNDIESAHFYNNHRQEATKQDVINTLNVYNIPVRETIDKHAVHIFEIYSTILREHVASEIVKAWFPEVTISNEFIDQIKIGYRYQQSPTPEKLPPIPSKFIWAHIVSYNPGLRKFDERTGVLGLQDIQEVISRTDVSFKQELRVIGQKYSSKFSDLVDDAERSKNGGTELSQWLLQNRSREDTYLYELDQYLSNLGKQQSFFFTSLLYLFLRDKILNADYTGKLTDNKAISYYLKNTPNITMRRSIAEALFTIAYAGGPRVFQKALIEARIKNLNLTDYSSKSQPTSTVGSDERHSSLSISRFFSRLKKDIGKEFEKRYRSLKKEKKSTIKKEIQIICSTKTKMSNGEFDYEQYVKLCSLLELPVQQFEDQPVEIEIVSMNELKDTDNIEKNVVKHSESNKSLTDFASPDNEE